MIITPDDVDQLDGPDQLKEAVKRQLRETDRMRCLWIGMQLEALDIGPWTPAGEVALAEYSPFNDDHTDSDFSLLRLRCWLADRLDMVTF